MSTSVFPEDKNACVFSLYLTDCTVYIRNYTLLNVCIMNLFPRIEIVLQYMLGIKDKPS